MLKLDCKINTLLYFVLPVSFTLSKKPHLALETSSSQEKHTNFADKKLALRKAELAKALEEIEMTTVCVRNIQSWDVGSKSIQLPWRPLWKKF